MKNNNNSSSFSHPHDQCQKHKAFKCEFCDQHFTSGQALGGHKTCHRSNNKIRDDHHRHKTVKITFFLTDKTIKKRYSWTRVLKPTVHHPPTALGPCQQEEFPAVDLLSLLPPRSYNTKKRSRRYLIHHGVSNNTPSIPPLDISRESVANLDANHRECKRMKLSSNVNDTEIMQKPFVPLTSDGFDETVVKEEKNLNGGETTVSRVVREFDLNDLPANDVETVVSRVVRNIDLNKLPTNGVETE
ncbi:unnamed protein product [Lathyrus sativus]|nr:unnamed protein product [Lathyrus sativus]